MPQQHEQPESQSDSALLFHPYNIMLSLLLLGLMVLFLSLTAAYIYTRVTMGVPPVQAPALFFLNTILLLSSSYTMVRAKRCYQADDTAGYQQNLKYTMGLSLGFMVMQTIAWILLFKSNIGLNTSTTAGYLYLISFVHLAHVIAGMPFLWYFHKTAKKEMIDPVTVLVYFSDPEKRLKLKLLIRYWHFLDYLWIYLVLFFAVNALI